jgi:hypothetical protein
MYKVYIEKDCVFQTGLILTDPDGKLYRRELDLFHEDVIYIYNLLCVRSVFVLFPKHLPGSFFNFWL